MRAVVAALALALLLAAAVYIGEVIGEHRNAADWRTVRAELDALDAALTAIPDDAVEYRQQVAADHRAKRQAAVERLDAYYLDLREAA
ncbi:hypothetical protein [Micromonospora peucetia]|uniref:Uncharacterized protein n=1 Tax=Micromonospora peucetia TaxID=47871 RepID=A0ABZ1EJU6_9ACTN|nr:hypothetical protein [Micromonospora peucetia]WSA34518.1 hypothetical protein OIE14_10990 [Micromonospora peucetia]